MKIILCFFFSIIIFCGHAQKIFFPAKNLSDSTAFTQTLSNLAERLIPLYSRNDKAEYYNQIFRLYYAKQDYKNVIQSLDSFDVHSKIEKSFFRVPGFHYRIYSMTMLVLQKDPAKDYKKEYASQFAAVYNTLNKAGQSQVKTVYEEADIAAEKTSFLSLVKKYQSTGSDSIEVNDAIDLLKQWNYWQVYDKTVAFAKATYTSVDAATLVNSEDKLLDLDEGAVLSPGNKIFIRNVTLVDVEKQQLISNTTVGITGSNIVSIGKTSKTTLPAGATIIDGTGKFLLPGLTDAHIHFFQSGGLYTRPDAINLTKEKPYEKEIEWARTNMKDVLKRYIHSGITSVIDVGATNNFLQLRDKFKNKSYAPEVFMTGPLLTSYEPAVFKKLKNDEPFSLVTNIEEGKEMVQQQLPYHPDFIKIWYILTDLNNKEAAAQKFFPIAKAIIEEAHKHNLKVAVHATERITAQFTVEAGCDFLVHSVDDEILNEDFIKLLKAKNVTLCPTLTVAHGYRNTFAQELNSTTNELRWSNPEQLGSLYDLKHLPEIEMINLYKTATKNNSAREAKSDSVSLVNLKKLVDAGVRIAAGTDAGNIGTLHGTSYLNELKEMKKAGMSNWQILQSATINPGYILGKEKETGSIAVGKKADMILLNANPVESLQNLEQIDLVINKGFIIRPDTLIKETPLALVQRQLNAYNVRNLEAFLEPYAEDVELYNFPSTLIAKGKAAMREQYAFFKKVKELHCEIKERIVQGNTIIDKESVSGFGGNPVEATAIYQIENNKIKRVYFISSR